MDEKNEEEYIKWAKQVIQSSFYFKNNLETQSGELSVTSFEMNLSRSDIVSRQEVYPIGDAAQSAYYPKGHGLNDAIAGGRVFSQSHQENKDPHAFREYIHRRKLFRSNALKEVSRSHIDYMKNSAARLTKSKELMQEVEGMLGLKDKLSAEKNQKFAMHLYQASQLGSSKAKKMLATLRNPESSSNYPQVDKNYVKALHNHTLLQKLLFRIDTQIVYLRKSPPWFSSSEDKIDALIDLRESLIKAIDTGKSVNTIIEEWEKTIGANDEDQSTIINKARFKWSFSDTTSTREMIQALKDEEQSFVEVKDKKSNNLAM